MTLIKQWAAGIVVFILLDAVWLGLVANGFYRRHLGSLLRMNGDAMNPRLLPALLLYVSVVLGLIIFALPRAQTSSLIEAAAWSAAFGIIGYGVYDLTNYATLRDFPLIVTVVDMAWGGVVCGATGAAIKALS